MARQKQERMCNYCGESRLFWKSFSGSWRLSTPEGELHRCQPDKREKYKADNPGIPNDVKADPMPKAEIDPQAESKLGEIAAQGETQSEQQGQGEGKAQGSAKGQSMAQEVNGQSEGKMPTEGEGEGQGGTQDQPKPNPEGEDIYSKVQGHVLADVDKKQTVLVNALAQVVGKELETLASNDATLASALQNIDKRIDAAVKAHIEKPKVVIFKQEGKPDIKLEGERPEMGDLLVSYKAATASRMGVMLVGPAGSGKTTACEKLSGILGLPFYPMSVGSQTSKSDLMGFIDAHGKVVRTVFREAFETGGLFLLDEIDAGNPNVLTQLNAAVGNRYCSFPDGVLKAHENFGVVAAANTFGNGASRLYVGRNQLDAATLNRFGMINWDYDHKLETALGDGNWVARIHTLRAAQESLGLRVVISTRAVILGTELLRSGMAQKRMEEIVLWNAMNEDDREKLQKAARG